MKKWKEPKIEELGIERTESICHWTGKRDGQWCDDENCHNNANSGGVHPQWS